MNTQLDMILREIGFHILQNYSIENVSSDYVHLFEIDFYQTNYCFSATKVIARNGFSRSRIWLERRLSYQAREFSITRIWYKIIVSIEARKYKNLLILQCFVYSYLKCIEIKQTFGRGRIILRIWYSMNPCYWSCL